MAGGAERVVKRYIVIGDGAAGLTAARALRLADGEARITVVSDDPHPTYYRAALTNYLLGELRDEQLWAVPPSFFEDYRIERHLDRVARIDAQGSRLWVTSTPQAIGYDALVIATGARCRPPTFDHADVPGVCTMRTLADTRWILDQLLGGVRQVAIVGGGPLAIEWAIAAKERGAHTTLLVREGRVMGHALDAVGSDLLLARLRHAGIAVRTGVEVACALRARDGRLGGVALKGGEQLPCGMLGAAIGVVPNSEFLAESGIRLGKRGGVMVGAHMRTNVPNVYAAGDVTEGPWPTVQLWETARRQAALAAANIVGSRQIYRAGTHYFATRLGDLDFASVGAVEGGDGCQVAVDHPMGTGSVAYRKVVMRGGKLVGALMLGQRSERVRARGRLYQKLIDHAMDVSSIADRLLDNGFDLSSWINRAALLEKPKATFFGAAPLQARSTPAAAALAAVAELPSNARLRGTQAVAIGALLRAGLDPASSAMPAASASDGAMLSIGLRAPKAPPPLETSDAWLEGAGQRWALRASVMAIGRGAGCDILLLENAVSRLHAQITWHGGALWIRDCGSRSGTSVNGRAVSVPHRLAPGDTIHVGQTTLRFHVARASQAEPRTA
jgi:NADPH-dependent 2,4-dienoyl-CoA reductase/sulfur reductase-like enzyme